MTHTLTDPVSPPPARGEHGGTRPTLPLDLLPPTHPDDRKMRGLTLVVVWVGLALAAWAMVAGLGYGLYALILALLE